MAFELPTRTKADEVAAAASSSAATADDDEQGDVSQIVQTFFDGASARQCVSMPCRVYQLNACRGANVSAFANSVGCIDRVSP